MAIFPRVVSILRSKDYVIYERPYELNIVGFRSKSTVANKFDDELHCFYRNQTGTGWNYHIYQVTTDPGTFYLGSTLGNELGTAILKQGQYLNSYSLGLHKGQYKALVNNLKPVEVIRDYDRDSILDFNNGRVYQASGINIHRGKSKGITKTVDNWSAGCTVFEDEEKFDEFIALCEKHKSLYGNIFTYTLMDFRAQRKETYKRIGIFSSIALLAFGTVMTLTDTELEDLVPEWS